MSASKCMGLGLAASAVLVLGLAYPQSADACRRCRRCCPQPCCTEAPAADCHTAPEAAPAPAPAKDATAQAPTDRRYSYEPSSAGTEVRRSYSYEPSYSSNSFSRRGGNAPLYSLPKTDPRKFGSW
jgi:hypothetical protein